MGRGHPFIVKSFHVRQSSFLNHLKHCQINSCLHDHANGNSVKIRVEEVIKSSIGEFQERLSIFKCLQKDWAQFGTPSFKGVHVLNGTIIDVPATDIILEPTSPIFAHVKKDTFTDTCGMAAHVNGRKAMEKAYFEYVERQSLIHMWLTKSEGEHIKPDLTNPSISRKYRLLTELLEKIYFVNISIRPDIYVIMTIGFDQQVFSVGLAAHRDINKAIESSIDEFIMIGESLISFKVETTGQPMASGNIFVDYFYNMERDEFYQEIKFLLESSSPMNKIEERTEEWNLRRSMKAYCEELDVDLYLVDIPMPIDTNSCKVVKLYSPDGYPHMHTELFDPSEYKISRSLKATFFPNQNRMIPFA
ncbi:YcaO-like family protein [Brevibacillus daliensis]|uniref:YcaO-like family protein n=1 Tax=Brevibacillus daliensis TaxID=2892995 RepID=UPI001E2FF61E|nr:YcaO-like family protein [Brevibacillus daliensis]